MDRPALPVAYRALWMVLAIALVGVFVVWLAQLGATVGARSAAEPTPTPVPRATAAPHIATVYSNIGPPDPASLCAELSPTPREVTVESTTGVVIATVQCSN